MTRQVIDQCQLCFKIKVLDKGHIMPRWSSRLSVKASEYFTITNNIQSLQDASVNQIPQGLRTEYLFCKECDNFFGVGEGWLREMIHPSANKPSSISSVNGFTIELKSEKIIKEFYIAVGGLLLKAHLSTEDPWKSFFLTNKQYKLIFNGIKNSNLSQYMMISMVKLYSLDNFKIGNFTDKINGIHQLPPSEAPFHYNPILMKDSTFTTILSFGGLVLIVTCHPRGYVNPYLSPNSLKIPILPADIRHILDQKELVGIGNMVTLSTNYKRVLKALKDNPLDSTCPCKAHFTNQNGVKARHGAKGNLNFGNCCYEYWGFDTGNN